MSRDALRRVRVAFYLVYDSTVSALLPVDQTFAVMRSCRSLPDEVWKVIVANLSTYQRFLSCSLVNQQLNRATAAATQQVELYSISTAKAESLGLYLQSHGHHLTTLAMYDCTMYVDGIKQLPCSQLRQLCLTRCQIQLAPSQSDPGILHNCSGLTNLSLSYCTELAPSTSLTAVAALTSLQHIHLNRCYFSGAGGVQEQMLPSLLIPHLPNLTHLNFGHGDRGHMQCLQQVSSLRNLQGLGIYWDYDCGPSTTPGLSSLQTLTSIALSLCRLDPAVLFGVTQLCALQLENVGIFSEAPTGADVGMLPSCIARMPCLQRLKLRDVEWPGDIAAYSALTASSNLKHLQLHGQELPSGVWQVMFLVGKIWPFSGGEGTHDPGTCLGLPS
jgi:hypothetical protein